jgi:hypothetical protein
MCACVFPPSSQRMAQISPPWLGSWATSLSIRTGTPGNKWALPWPVPPPAIFSPTRARIPVKPIAATVPQAWVWTTAVDRVPHSYCGLGIPLWGFALLYRLCATISGGQRSADRAAISRRRPCFLMAPPYTVVGVTETSITSNKPTLSSLCLPHYLAKPN